MDVLALYRQEGALLEGHFLLASGRHSPKFLQSTTVLQWPKHAVAIGEAIAALYADLKPDFVLGPAMGGVVLAHTVAQALSCRALFAEKDGSGGMKIREAFTVNTGERFLAVEDVITTGGSLKKAVAAAERAGGIALGVGCIIDRGQADFGTLPLRALQKLSFDAYPPDSCPLCADGVPLEEV